MTDRPHHRQRLRFESIHHEAAPDGRCRVRTRLEWCDRHYEGEARGLETHEGRIRAAAEATLDAAVSASGKRVHLELVGVKSVRAFDGWVVVVRLNATAQERAYRLLGSASCEAEDGLVRCAAHAVLDATNRVLEQYVRR